MALTRGKRLAIATAAIGIAVAAAGAVPIAQAIIDRWYRIPVVRTWGDLLAVEPLEVGKGKVRIGIEARSCPAGTGVLLYLLAEYDGPASSGRFGRGLRVCVLPEDDARQEGTSPSLKFEQFHNAPQDLFLQVIPACRAGKVDVSIVAPDGGVLRSATLRVTEREYHGWSPLLQDTDASPHELLPRQAGHEDETTAHVIAGPCKLAVPCWDGNTPYFAEDVRRGIAAPDLTLPGLFPRDELPGLELEVDRGNLLVRAEGESIRMGWPELRFLSRWWVNGVPVQPQEGGPWHLDGEGLEPAGSRLRLFLKHVPNLTGARSGDIIGVQLLYLDRGWQFPHNLGIRGRHGYADPCRALLSNRVELVVP